MLIYQRPIFGALGALYCICLGVIALIQNRHSRLNRTFAAYNFCLAGWNFSDIAGFLPPSMGLNFMRVLGIPGCFIIPFVVDFIYQLLGISTNEKGKRVIKTLYVLAIVFSVLHLTPFILKDLHYTQYQFSNFTQVTGALYPFFAIFLLGGLLMVIVPIPHLYKTTSGIKQQQVIYVSIACVFGLLGLSAFFLSFWGRDYPYLYYGFEALIGFTFSYAIFKHDLIPARIALRRAGLLIGIYIAIILILFPLTAVVYKHYSLGTLIGLIFVMGILFSMGPFIYSFMLRRLSLFHEKTATHLTHELKSPLSAIQSAKSILDDELSKPNPDLTKLKDYMDLIGRNSTRLESFVQATLNYNQLNEVANPSELSNVNLAELCQTLINENPSLPQKTSFSHTGDTNINAHFEGLQQVVANLLSNAAKFAKDEIKVSVIETTQGCECRVWNNGTQIDKKDLERIFEPFVKLSTGTVQKKGSGLGLAIAKKWVDYHNGRIWAESTHQGTTLIFTLPK